jgi:hypothetical protein
MSEAKRILSSSIQAVCIGLRKVLSLTMAVMNVDRLLVRAPGPISEAVER